MPDDDVRGRVRPAGGEVEDLVDRGVRQLCERPRLPVVEPALREQRVEAALEPDPGPRSAQIEQGLAKLTQRPDDRLALLDRSREGPRDDEDGPPVELGGNGSLAATLQQRAIELSSSGADAM
jgi:hypothetical protein